LEVANCEQVTIKGLIQLELSIQKYGVTFKLHGIDLTTGFDMIIGNTWGKTNGVLVDYEYPLDGDPKDPRYSLPMLILHSTARCMIHAKIKQAQYLYSVPRQL
jgi:hypothetical protein